MLLAMSIGMSEPAVIRGGPVRSSVMSRVVIRLARMAFAAAAVVGAVVAVSCGAAWVRSYFAAVRLGVSTEHWEVSVIAEDGWLYGQGWEVIGGYGKSATLAYAVERAWEWRGGGRGLFADPDGEGAAGEEGAAGGGSRRVRWSGPRVERVVAVHFAWPVMVATALPAAWAVARR